MHLSLAISRLARQSQYVDDLHRVAATPSVIENDSMNRGLCQRNLSDKIGMFLYRYSFSIITLALVLQAAVIYGTFPTPVEMI